MPRTSAKTTAANLEAKFDANEDVLDYFDVDAASVVYPKATADSASGRGSSLEPRLTVERLKQAIKITKQIRKLESELHSILGR